MLRGALMVIGIAAIPAGFHVAHPVRVTLPQPERTLVKGSKETARVGWDSIAILLVSRDPFRPDRHPAPVAFSPAPAEASDVESQPPKPSLLVSGIVWSSEPSAVVEGLPGVEGGKLMRPGETANGITLRRMTRDHVVLSGLDTTWVLFMRKPW